MTDFEDRVRAGLGGAADDYAPSPGLRGDVDRRVRRHRRARVAWGVASAVGALVLVAGLGVLLATDDDGNQAEGYAGASLPGVTVVVEHVDDDDSPAPCEDWSPDLLVVSSITERYVGLTEAAARAQAEDEGMPVKVVCRDGLFVPRKLDLLPGRLDLQIDGGEVVAVAVEGSEYPPATVVAPRR